MLSAGLKLVNPDVQVGNLQEQTQKAHLKQFYWSALGHSKSHTDLLLCTVVAVTSVVAVFTVWIERCVEGDSYVPMVTRKLMRFHLTCRSPLPTRSLDVPDLF